MKNIILILYICIGLPFFTFASGEKDSQTLTVFAAASTTDLMAEVSEIYRDKTGISIQINAASSGTLAKQIENGAESDVYISASQKWLNYVEDLGVTAQSQGYLKNSLVLIEPLQGELPDLRIDQDLDFLNIFEGRLSMGDPDHVPAGKYGAKALAYFDWYDSLSDRILPGADVRAAMAVVELGECDLGIVYATDAKKSELVKVIGTFPEESHPTIEYGIALMDGAKSGGDDLYDFLINDPQVADLYSQYGFQF